MARSMPGTRDSSVSATTSGGPVAAGTKAFFWVEVSDALEPSRALMIRATATTPVFEVIKRWCKAFEFKLSDFEFENAGGQLSLMGWDGFPLSLSMADIGFSSAVEHNSPIAAYRIAGAVPYVSHSPAVTASTGPSIRLSSVKREKPDKSPVMIAQVKQEPSSIRKTGGRALSTTASVASVSPAVVESKDGSMTVDAHYQLSENRRHEARLSIKPRTKVYQIIKGGATGLENVDGDGLQLKNAAGDTLDQKKTAEDAGILDGDVLYLVG